MSVSGRGPCNLEISGGWDGHCFGGCSVRTLFLSALSLGGERLADSEALGGEAKGEGWLHYAEVYTMMVVSSLLGMLGKLRSDAEWVVVRTLAEYESNSELNFMVKFWNHIKFLWFWLGDAAARVMQSSWV